MNRKCCGKCCAAALVAAALLISSPAAAQTPPLTLAPASSHLWDISGDIGWFNSRRSEVTDTWDQWYDAPAASASVGRYWTPHIRSDFRLSVAGEGRTFQQDRSGASGELFPRYHEHYFRTAAAGVGLSYQFLENQWFHPFAGGGVDVERESHRILSPELRLPPRPEQPPLVLPRLETGPTVSYAARPFVTVGFKWYMHERAFIRSDLKTSFGRNQNFQNTFSAGIGVDL